MQKADETKEIQELIIKKFEKPVTDKKSKFTAGKRIIRGQRQGVRPKMKEWIYMYSERNFITRKEDKQESKGYSIRYILKKDRLNKIGYDSKNEVVLYIFMLSWPEKQHNNTFS